MKNQKGLTLISWLGLLGLLLFNALIAMKVVPVYINDHSVKAMMQDIEQDSTIKGTTPKKIKEMISKRLRINNVYSIKKDDIVLKKTKKGYTVTIEYEPRGQLIGSLDYIVTFRHEAIIPVR